MNQRSRIERLPSGFPRQSWYVVATSEEVTRSPLAARALNEALVLYRTSDGSVAVLEDRDAHRPFPLSLGRVVDDEIVSAYSGFVYGRDGRCVRVPTQPEVPYGARVRAYPVVEQDGFVWVWFGDARVARLHTPPRAPWLADPAWSTFGDEWTTNAGFLLLHENFADITHVAVVDPDIAPPVLTAGPVPLLEVEVSETSVSFSRNYPPAPLAPWHAPLVNAATTDSFAQREEGRFVSPGLWVDSWDVIPGEPSAEVFTFRFTHAVTPLTRDSTRHVWRVSRNFAPGAEVSANLGPIFRQYYTRVQSILEIMQRVLDEQPAREDVSVAADAAALQVRRIVGRMLTGERAG